MCAPQVLFVAVTVLVLVLVLVLVTVRYDLVRLVLRCTFTPWLYCTSLGLYGTST